MEQINNFTSCQLSGRIIMNSNKNDTTSTNMDFIATMLTTITPLEPTLIAHSKNNYSASIIADNNNDTIAIDEQTHYRRLLSHSLPLVDDIVRR